MRIGRQVRIRRQSITAWAAASAACMIVSSLSIPAGLVFAGGWFVSMLLAIYILPTRTFKLSSDRYSLVFGALMPGVIVLEILHVLALPVFGLVSAPSGGLRQTFGIAGAALMAVALVASPRLARVRVHRYVWTSVSLTAATILASLVMFSPLVPAEFGTHRFHVLIMAGFTGAIALTFFGVMLWLVHQFTGGRQARRGMPGRESLRFMAVAAGLLGISQCLELLGIFKGGWFPVIGFLFEGGALFLIVDGLVYRGLEVPVREITRSRAQLEAGVSAAADGLLIHDLAGRVISMNWRFRTALIPETSGDTPVDNAERLLDALVSEVVSPDPIRKKVRKILAAPSSEGFERVELRDGRVLEVYSVPYMYDGRIDGRVWSLRDVSVRERTTAQLERSNWRLDNILTSAGDGLFEINLERGTLWLHSNWMNVVDCEAGAVPSSWDEFKAMIHPEDLPALNRGLRQPYDRREFRVEFRMPDSRSNWRWYLCVGRIERIETGHDRAEWVLSGVQRDITSEKVQEDELRRQRGLMEALIENMPLGAFVKEASSGRYLLWNSRLARLIGVPTSQVIGRNDADLLSGDMRNRAAKSDKEVISQGVSLVIENSWMGETIGRNIRLRKIPVVDADRTVKLIIGIVEDVTEQQQVERLVHQTRSLEALGRLAGGIAHDFNNILQVIIGAADALKLEHAGTCGSREEVDQILEAGERARSLIGQLLNFSRQDISTREPLDVDKLISGLLKMLQRLIGADIAVSVRPSGSRLLVIAERTRLEQVLMNLTVNAVDAMPYGGSLTITADSVTVDESTVAGHSRCQPGRYARVVVSDSGIGIPKEVLEHMWEPFYSTKDVGKGTGLGLSTVYGIVDSLGGFIQVQSEMGHGSSFSVYLPLYSSVENLSPETQSESGKALPANRRTILVAHSDADRVADEAKALEKAGFSVVAATSGPEALQRLAEADQGGGISLMILDVVMVGVGGCDIFDIYLSDHIAIPVIFCAETAAPMLDDEYLEYVHGRLLHSPYSRRQLMLAVRSLLPD